MLTVTYVQLRPEIQFVLAIYLCKYHQIEQLCFAIEKKYCIFTTGHCFCLLDTKERNEDVCAGKGPRRE